MWLGCGAFSSCSWIEDNGVWAMGRRCTPRVGGGVCGRTIASLGDESFWKLAASQYDDHEFDSFDVDDRFPVARNISADCKYHG